MIREVHTFKDKDYSDVVFAMFVNGAYALARRGIYIHLPGQEHPYTLVLLQWRPRIEQNEEGRYN